MKKTKKIMRKLLENALSSSMNVNRDEWLYQVLQPYCSESDLEKISVSKPEDLVTPMEIDKIAEEVVQSGVTRTTVLCGGSGLISRLNMGLGITTDLFSYFCNLVTMAQKLAYLYGWNNSFFDGKPTAESYARFRLIMGYAVGHVDCKYPLLEVSPDAVPCVLSHEDNASYCRWDDAMVKKMIKDFGLQVGKASISSLLSKRFTLLGMSLTGGWSYFSFNIYAKKIHSLLRETMYYRLERNENF